MWWRWKKERKFFFFNIFININLCCKIFETQFQTVLLFKTCLWQFWTFWVSETCLWQDGLYWFIPWYIPPLVWNCWPCQCNSFEVRVPYDEIYWYPIIWILVIEISWSHDHLVLIHNEDSYTPGKTVFILKQIHGYLVWKVPAGHQQYWWVSEPL